MGLDWVLKSKVIEGKEEEHAEARKRRLEARDRLYEQIKLGADKLILMELEEVRDRLEDEENALEISPCAVLGCPRVGFDQEATDFVTQAYSEFEQPESLEAYPTLESWLKANHGKYVPELAKNSDGFGKVTGIASGPESFRGKVVGYAMDLVGDNLAERAYQDMDPDEMAVYADALEAKVNAWEQENEKEIEYFTEEGPTGETQFQKDRVANFPKKSQQEWGAALDRRQEVYGLVNLAGNCRDAVTWLRFWAKHGFSMHAWS